MKSFKAIFRALLIWFRIIPQPDLIVRVVSDHPVPATLETGWIYIVGGPGYQKWAYFRCPADTEEIIQLSLMPNHRPRWEVTMDFLDRPTVHPSVCQLNGSYAHFWIKQGRIKWCADTGMPHRDRSLISVRAQPN